VEDPINTASVLARFVQLLQTLDAPTNDIAYTGVVEALLCPSHPSVPSPSHVSPSTQKYDTHPVLAALSREGTVRKGVRVSQSGHIASPHHVSKLQASVAF
jgi:hypothetical protein